MSKAFGEAICLRIGAVTAEDDPTKNARLRKVWLSHRDLVQLVEKSLKSNVTFGIYYRVSNNKGVLGYLECEGGAGIRAGG